MKRFLNWTGAKLNWFFGSWRFPAAFLAFALLVVLFYAEEDWRGAHRWAVNKAKWEAKGETFDYAKFIPPPVPDGQNLAAIPLFKLEPRSKTDSYLDPIVLQKAMRQGVSNYNLPPTNSGKPDGLPDLPKMRAAIAENYALVFPGTKPPGSALAQLDALYPFLRNFLAAAATRPLCRLPGDYNTSPPAERPLGVVVAGIGLSRILTYQAILALDEHQPDLALADIKANYIVLSGVKRDPTLVGGLVGIGMMVIAQAALAEGFAQHAWNDEQLVEIDQMLKPIHFLDDYQFALKCEAAESSANIDWIKTQGAKEWIHRLGQTDFYVPATVLFAASWPRGWWDDNKSQTTDFYFREMSTIDPRAQRVFPECARQLKEEFARLQARWDANAPWNYLFTLSTSPLSDQTSKYALAQVRIDEARIAVALERYRLAHGDYPESLEVLAPAFIAALPHDVMNGAAYHYKLQKDGSYLLYSVGWNQKDDGGAVAYKQGLPEDVPPRVDYEQGDWPWVMPK